MTLYQFWSGVLPVIVAAFGLLCGFLLLVGTSDAACRFGSAVGTGLFRWQRSIGWSIGVAAIETHRSMESRMELLDDLISSERL